MVAGELRVVETRLAPEHCHGDAPVAAALVVAGFSPGAALVLLLAGPALSLPSMLVIHGVLGTRKTLAFVLLVVAMATLSGVLYGNLLA